MKLCVKQHAEKIHNIYTKHRHARRAKVIICVCVCVCEWKDPGGSCTQWTLNSYDKVNPATFFGYDVQRKKKLEFVSL